MKKEELKNILVERGYSPKNAVLVVPELLNLDVALIPLFENWITNPKNCEDYQVDDYSIYYFMQKRHMTYPAALLTIDWLIKEPDKAKKAINRKH